jgi:hypothetical protein
MARRSGAHGFTFGATQLAEDHLGHRIATILGVNRVLRFLLNHKVAATRLVGL